MQTLDATESGVLLPSVGTPDHLLLQLAVIGPLLLTASSRAESNYAGRIHQAARLLDAALLFTLPMPASRCCSMLGRHDRRFIYISRMSEGKLLRDTISALLHHAPNLLLHSDSDWPAAPLWVLQAVPLPWHCAGLRLVQVFRQYAFKQYLVS